MVLCVPGHSAIVPSYFSPAGTVPKFDFFFSKHVINLWHQVLEIRQSRHSGHIDRTCYAQGSQEAIPRTAYSKGSNQTIQTTRPSNWLVTRLVLLRPKPESRASRMVHFLLCEGSSRFLQSMKSFPIVNIMLLNSILSSYYVSHPSIIVATSRSKRTGNGCRGGLSVNPIENPARADPASPIRSILQLQTWS